MSDMCMKVLYIFFVNIFIRVYVCMYVLCPLFVTLLVIDYSTFTDSFL